MTTTEIVLIVWLGLVNSVCIWLCFERDRLHERINQLDAALGYTWERAVKKGQQ